MRRAEMARRRKNLSEKRNEEEKVRERSSTPTKSRLHSLDPHPDTFPFKARHPLSVSYLLHPNPLITDGHDQPAPQETSPQAPG